ncbi:hypothetical protein L1987_71403 [Smallanthus sonchifolius]|uniref:Uncharacterized protein n=1 Tax=Smallanthus sonchifolius TaxID=185202 RepID=A0ACB9ASB0_9ASTR|nr:hypothetical protein L1987_71403 [Smallanthus sonchifolius]
MPKTLISLDFGISIENISASKEDKPYYDQKKDFSPYVASNAHDFNDGSRIPVIPLDVVNDETPPDDPLISPGPTVKVGEKTTQDLLPRDEVIGTAVALVAFIKSKKPVFS